MNIRRLPLILIFGALVSLDAQSQTPSDQKPETEVLRISTRLVTVPVTAKTRQGAYVANLTREDFRIYEDSIEQKISHFDSVDKPFTVVLMLDISDSTRMELAEIQNAAIAFLNQLKPDDRAQIVAFDKQLVKLTVATSDRDVLSNAIRQLKTGGGTALYDAVATTISELAKGIPGRKAVVLLTDGIDTQSMRATYDSTVRSATEQCVLIYPIQWDTPNDYLSKQLSSPVNDANIGGVMYTTPKGESLRKAYERGTRYLQFIAHTSGGRFQYADNVKNLNRSFSRIAEELRQQYSLSYYPRNEGIKDGKRRIKITVNAPDIVVHSRDNYIYKAETQ